MSILSEKLELIQWLAGLKDTEILNKIKWLKEKQKEATDWWDELEVEEEASIQRGLNDLKNDKVSTHQEAKKVYGKWL